MIPNRKSSSTSSQQIDQRVNFIWKKMNNLAKLKGEFGFATLSEDEMQAVLKQLIQDEIIK